MITKSAVDKTNLTQKLIFTNSARSAWSHILYEFKKSAQPKVLLPSYIGFTEREGSGVFDPIEENSADYRFYKLDNLLRIDIDNFARIIRSGEVNIVLIIHYFGFCRNDMNEIKDLCTSNGVLLVEDCAHAFHLGVADQKIGNYGDYSFYSLHKYIATNSGGALKINSNIENSLPISEDKKISQSDLEQYAKTELLKVAESRRRNFLLYKRLLLKNDKFEIMYDLLSGDIPQSFPILIKRGMREKLYFHLINNAIPVTALYYRLIDQIKIEEFPNAFEVSGEILNLPLHQDMTQEGIEVLCKFVMDFFNDGVN